MGIIDAAKEFLFGAAPDGDEKPPPPPVMPDVKALVAASDALKPPGYDAEIERAVAYLTNNAAMYATKALRQQFPNTAQYMSPVDLGLYRRFIVEQSRALVGRWSLDLVGASEEQAALWADVQARVHIRRKLVEVARRANALRKVFVRVTWDARQLCVRLTMFAPHKVHLPYAADATRLEDLDRLALELAPVRSGPLMEKRREVWTRGEGAMVWIVNERGTSLAEGPNPYADDAGQSIIPLVEFTTVDPDDGAWQLPDAQLLGAAEAINAQLTNAWHVAKLGVYGQPISERTSEGTDDEWPGEVPRGPEVVIDVPRGRTYRVDTVNAGVEKLEGLVTSLIGQTEASASLPPGSVLQGSRTVPSGVALLIERAPLDELRQDHLDLLTPSIERLADVVRWVWNAHQPSNSTRLMKLPAKFTAGAVHPPLGVAERAQADEAQIRIGTSSAVRVLMRDRGLSREDAMALAAEIAAENRAARGATVADFAQSLRATPEVP